MSAGFESGVILSCLLRPGPVLDESVGELNVDETKPPGYHWKYGDAIDDVSQHRVGIALNHCAVHAEVFDELMGDSLLIDVVLDAECFEDHRSIWQSDHTIAESLVAGSWHDCAIGIEAVRVHFGVLWREQVSVTEADLTLDEFVCEHGEREALVAYGAEVEFLVPVLIL